MPADSKTCPTCGQPMPRQKRQRNGFPGGSVPFGYTVQDVNGAAVLVADPARKKAIAAMRRLRADGESFRAIAEHVREAYGLAVSHEGVRRLLGQG